MYPCTAHGSLVSSKFKLLNKKDSPTMNNLFSRESQTIINLEIKKVLEK